MWVSWYIFMRFCYNFYILAVEICIRFFLLLMIASNQMTCFFFKENTLSTVNFHSWTSICFIFPLTVFIFHSVFLPYPTSIFSGWYLNFVLCMNDCINYDSDLSLSASDTNLIGLLQFTLLSLLPCLDQTLSYFLVCWAYQPFFIFFPMMLSF